MLLGYNDALYKLLADRAFNEDEGSEWVDWALARMEEGREGEYLYILAGKTPPFHRFELNDLVTRVLQEAGIPLPSKRQAVFNYTYHIVSAATSGAMPLDKALEKLYELYGRLENAEELQRFYLLYWAWADVLERGEQFYWQTGSDDLESDVRLEMTRWKKAFELCGGEESRLTTTLAIVDAEADPGDQLLDKKTPPDRSLPALNSPTLKSGGADDELRAALEAEGYSGREATTMTSSLQTEKTPHRAGRRRAATYFVFSVLLMTGLIVRTAHVPLSNAFLAGAVLYAAARLLSFTK